MVVNHGIADGFSNIAVGQTQIIAAKRQLNVVCQSGVEEKSVEAKTQPADQEAEGGRAQVCPVFAFIKKAVLHPKPHVYRIQRVFLKPNSLCGVKQGGLIAFGFALCLNACKME